MRVSMVAVRVVMYSSHVTALMVIMEQNIQRMGQKGSSGERDYFRSFLITFQVCVMYFHNDHIKIENTGKYIPCLFGLARHSTCQSKFDKHQSNIHVYF